MVCTASLLSKLQCIDLHCAMDQLWHRYLAAGALPSSGQGWWSGKIHISGTLPGRYWPYPENRLNLLRYCHSVGDPCEREKKMHRVSWADICCEEVSRHPCWLLQEASLLGKSGPLVLSLMLNVEFLELVFDCFRLCPISGDGCRVVVKTLETYMSL